MNKVKYQRKTTETEIEIEFLLKGEGRADIDSSLGYLDHFLTLFCFWGGFDPTLRARGDTHVDAHHLVEDIGLSLGKVFNDSLLEKKGIARIGWVRVPMDEALCEVVVDLSGRPYLVYNNDYLLPPVIFGEEKDLWREFFKSFSSRGGLNLHISFIYGKNGHHMLEATFKALGIALKKATTVENPDKTMSTKGMLE